MRSSVLLVCSFALLSCGINTSSHSESSVFSTSAAETAATSELTTISSSGDITSAFSDMGSQIFSSDLADTVTIDGIYSLSWISLGAPFSTFTFSFEKNGYCEARWELDGESFVSHQLYAIEENVNVMYDAYWNIVSFTPALEAGDVDLPEDLLWLGYKYFDSTYETLTFFAMGR